MNESINYYDVNAKNFNASTYHVEMGEIYQPFLANVVPKGKILDIGCGSGRDSLYFKKNGYEVEAFDYSMELVELARKQTNLQIQHASFYEISASDKYDGIWACASLLHCERERLSDVIQRIVTALKNNGICYMSFKYGEKDRDVDGRKFTDLNEKQSKELLAPFNVSILNQWVTVDQRPNRSEKWLNILFKK